MKLRDILKGFTPITAGDDFDLTGYEGPPRFWHSLAFLSSDSANHIGMLEGAKVIIRVKVLHGRVIAYMPFPPFGAEHLVKELAEEGISCKVSDWDLENNTVSFKLDKENIEHCYRASESIEGKIWKNIRYGKNILENRIKSGELMVTESPLEKDLKDLAARWYDHKKAARQHTAKTMAQTLHIKRKKTIRGIYAGHTLIAASALEHTSDRTGAIVMRLRDYSDPLSDRMTEALHFLDLQEALQNNLWLTIGSSVGEKGLFIHKTRLSPSTQHQIYSTETKKVLTLDDYRDWKESLSNLMPLDFS